MRNWQGRESRRLLILAVIVLTWGRSNPGAEPATDGSAATESANRPEAEAGSTGDAPLIASVSEPGVEHPLAPAIRIAQNSLMRLQTVQDYEATLVRSERVGGRLSEHTMHLKVRENPLSIYLKYGEPLLGREALFVQGQNGDQLLVNGRGATTPVGTAPAEPHKLRVNPDDRRRITELGMRPMLGQVIAQWKFESQYGECDVQYYPDARLRGEPCEVIESSHPRPRRQFKFQKTRVYFDARTRLPIRFEQHAFPSSADQQPELDERYEYINLRTNVGLTDLDFDRQNPNYSF